MKLNRIALILACVAAPAVLTACGSSSKAEKSSDSMSSTGARLDKSTGQVDSVMNALDKVVANKTGDLKSAFKKYGGEVDKTMDAADDARRSAEAMKATANNQFEAWVKEAQNINDPSMQKLSLERRDQAKTTFTRVQEDGQRVKAAYQPFIANLKDIRTFLDSDLSAHGVDALSKQIAKAHEQATALKAEINTMQKAMTEFKSQLK